MRTYILDDDGNPVRCDDIVAWGHWYQNTRNRIVAQDFDEQGEGISTVFLGMDHSFTEKGPPILWETLVFGGPLDGEMERYSSLADALMGHAVMRVRVREAEANRAPK